jgi:hypothetical protein
LHFTSCLPAPLTTPTSVSVADKHSRAGIAVNFSRNLKFSRHWLWTVTYTVFWDLTPCSMIKIFRIFEELTASIVRAEPNYRL